MEMSQLRCVVAIAEYGTFTRAAAALHMSQPALSHAVSRLERELGCRLFDRSSARTQLTEAGTVFLAPARRALAEVSVGREAVAAITGVLAGDLRITSVRAAVADTGRMLAAFHGRHPQVRLIVHDPDDDRAALDALRGGRTDIAIVHGGTEPTDLPTVEAGQQEFFAAFPAANAPDTGTVSLKEVAEYPLVAPINGSSARIRHDGLLRASGHSLHIAAECSDADAKLELVSSGIGVALTTVTAVTRSDRTDLAFRRIEPPVVTSLVAVRRSHSSPAADAFCRELLTANRPARD